MEGRQGDWKSKCGSTGQQRIQVGKQWGPADPTFDPSLCPWSRGAAHFAQESSMPGTGCSGLNSRERRKKRQDPRATDRASVCPCSLFPQSPNPFELEQHDGRKPCCSPAPAGGVELVCYKAHPMSISHAMGDTQ